MSRRSVFVLVACLLLMGLTAGTAGARHYSGVGQSRQGGLGVPSITTVNPTHALPGTNVTLTGSGFGASKGSGYVQIGKTTVGGDWFSFGTLTTYAWNDTAITCRIPEVVAGAYQIRVITQSSPFLLMDSVAFTVDAFPPPAITGLTPDHGLPGTTVVISGSDFRTQEGGTTMVRFGTTNAVVTIWGPTGITCLVPDVAPGAVAVAVTVLGQTSNTWGFTVDAPAVAPQITSITPDHGLPGASVTIAGSGFGASQGTSSVTIGGGVAGVTSWSATSISCVVPTVAAGATTVTVTVGGLPSNAAAFTVDGVSAAPSITGLSPDHGAPGAAVTITGSGFGATRGTSSVRFGATAAAVVSWSASSIACVVPTVAAGATTVAVTVGALDSNAVPFTVEASVSVARVTLALGGLRAGALKRGHSVTARCFVTPLGLAGETCRLTVQKSLKGVGWVTIRGQSETIARSGTCSWKYKPATRGSYRMQATVAATAAHTAAASRWSPFKVK